MKRLLVVAGATFLAAVVLSVLLRGQASRAESVAEASSFPRFDTVAELTAAGLVPYRVQVPKDHEVHLLLRGAPDAREGMVTLTGYADRTGTVDIGPGISREIVFTSSRPGDDFGFTLGSDIVGRLEVTGGHLEEGHQ
jgi:hypothetical protein